MGKDARIKQFRRAVRQGDPLTAACIAIEKRIPTRAARRAKLSKDAGSASIQEIGHAFMRVHGITQCSLRDAAQWAAAHHQSGVDWRMLPRAAADVSG